MTLDAESLLDQAERVATKAHAPYSHFRVGAVVALPDGTIHAGCNVENSAYGASVCAEVNAITTAVAAGATEIDTIAIVCLDGQPCTPCGNCRQVMREFGVNRILTRDAGGSTVEHTLDDLLPESFGPEALP
ncbi:MAG: cytidine deaminase [Acidimicrobiia bacterium]|nr:MAG: cytidine deaminase [Acidimicrobiia bacterium]